MDFHTLSTLFFLVLVQKCFATPHDTPDFPLPENLKPPSVSVFTEFSGLLKKYNPLNLGEGSPDYPPSKILQKAMVDAAVSTDYSLSQYSDDKGHPRLLKAVSTLFSKLSNQTLSPDENVIITAGAIEALFVTISSHTFPDEEWIVFEPYFEHYYRIIRAAHGVPRFIKLKSQVTEGNVTSADWTFDKEELSDLFNEKTKGVLLNTPHNPFGKVFSFEELTFIADLAKKWNTIVVSDEVYQFLTFDNNKHIHIATLPGMFERTITIGSAGKMFGATGYRIGWAYGDSKLIKNLNPIHGITVMCAPTPIQEAVAVALEQEIEDYGQSYSFLERLRKQTEANRNQLYHTLSSFGMKPILPEAGYFLVANWTTVSNSVTLDTDSSECEDYTFAKWLIQNVKVLGLPMSSFYGDVKKCDGKDILRFTIIKKNETYVNTENLFRKWKSQQCIEKVNDD